MKNGESRNSKKFFDWRDSVYARDNYTCQGCGAKESLCAHHIARWKDSKELRFEISNGITVCRECHFEIHSHDDDYGMSGKKHSDNAKEKMSAAKIGLAPSNKGHKASDEARKKMSLAKIGIKRKPFTEATKKKMSEARIGKKIGYPTQETINKMRESQKKISHINNAHYKGKTWYKCKETGKRIWIIN